MRSLDRRYLLRAGAAALGYVVVLTACLVGVRFVSGWVRWALVAMPVLALAVAVWALVQRFADVDAELRQRLLVAVAVGGAVVAVAAFAWGLLQVAGAPALNPALLVVAWVAGFALTLGLRR